jgi:hypothetical protein
MEKTGEEISSCRFRQFIRSIKRPIHHAQPRRKRRTADLVDNQISVQWHPPPSVRESLYEIRGHLNSVCRMFEAISTRLASELKAIESHEIPRYLSEALALVEEIERQLVPAMTPDFAQLRRVDGRQQHGRVSASGRSQ